MTKETGGSAFPMLGNVAHKSDWIMDEGMNLRDWFAGQALIGALSKYGFGNTEKYSSNECINACAENAYQLADAMIKERGRQ